ncbi:MobF family relaxase [Kitasatospora cinereorecta]|uniref:MobF family relaxase n=1 Tax=Kitasatospora cinereorecta TaxID=285560 RepID=A0ABW0V7Y0_9ACTN
MTAVAGYLYFERQITSGDQPRPSGCELTEYQRDAGLPPGVWVGRAAALLGVRGEVSERQMMALFGEGLHPLADDMTFDLLRAGAGVEQALNAVRLGARYYRLDTSPTDLARRIEALVSAVEKQRGEPVTHIEHRRFRRAEGLKAFRTAYGRGPKNLGELDLFIQRLTAPARQPIMAWHYVAQAPPSIGLLWALGDETVRVVVEQCHDEAVAVTLRWIEEHALATRSGRNGIAQHDVTTGLIGVRFRHFDSRAGDPGLHDHILVANKVQNPQGAWRAIDGRLLLAQTVSASEVYNAEVVHRVCAALGLVAVERTGPDGRRPIMEIAGIGEDLIDTVSSRSHAIRRRLPQLTDVYRAEHGTEPSPATRVKLASRATLETRPEKEVRPLSELRAHWRERAVDAFGPEVVDNLLANARAAARRLESEHEHPAPDRSPGTDNTEPRPGNRARPVDVENLARTVVETVERHRAVFGQRHVRAEAYRQITRTGRGTAAPGDWAEQVTEYALSRLCLDLTPPDVNPPFAPLQRADGTSIYRRRDAQLYTTPALLAAEDAVVAAARTAVSPPCTPAAFEYERFRHAGRLDAGQIAVARAFATSPRQLVAAIGPAGAGKTTALRLVADALAASGRRVVALAPSARSAQILGEELGTPADTIHHWLHRQDLADTSLHTPDRAEVLRRGDTVIVDEAGMAATLHLAAVVARAKQVGAHVRLVGDPAQLAAVESGGVLRLLQSEVGAVHFTTVHRFRTPGEKQASLRLRDGDPAEAFTWYRQHHRLHGGGADDMLDAALAAWQMDLAAGHTAVLAAPTRDLTAALNTRAQSIRLAAGSLRPTEHDVLLGDGHRAHIGDTVVTRRNERRRLCRGGKDFVKNGDTWTVESYTKTGAAIVRHTQHRGRVILPPAYLAHHTELGYAATVHRIQGMTVDSAHAILTSRTTREAAYVAATRGRHTNHLYVVLESGEHLDDALHRIATTTEHAAGARQTIRDQQQHAWGITQLVAEYTDAASRADELRHRNAAHLVLGQAARQLLSDGSRDATTTALIRAEQAGLAPWAALALAHHAHPDASGADLLRHLDRLIETASVAQPAARLTPLQREILQLLARTYRTAARAELRAAHEHLSRLPASVTIDGRTYPAWPHRSHGHLTDQQLAATLEVPWNAADKALHHEQQLRAAMHLDQRTREDEQRRRTASVAGAASWLSPVHHHALLSAAHDRLHAARQACQHAEAAASNLTTDQSLHNHIGDSNLPDWLTCTSALHDPLTPPDWRQHLLQRRSVIDHHLATRGSQLAADPPAWARLLGPVTDPSAAPAARAEWERTAALADAWRALHHLPDRVPAIGNRPTSGADPAAWHHLNSRITQLAHRTHQQSVPAPAAGLPERPHQPLPTSPVRRSLPPHAERLGDEALAAALTDTPAPQKWIEHISTPDSEDTAQQRLYRDLVAACAHWRMRHHIATTDPLGPQPENQHLSEWQHLSNGLNTYQRARIEDRLHQLHADRDANRQCAAEAARPATTPATRRRRPDRVRRRDLYGARRPKPPSGPRPN